MPLTVSSALDRETQSPVMLAIIGVAALCIGGAAAALVISTRAAGEEARANAAQSAVAQRIALADTCPGFNLALEEGAAISGASTA